MFLLVFLTGILLGAHGYNHFAEAAPTPHQVSVSRHSAFLAGTSSSTNPSNQTEHKEKRHGKSLITEAIVAEFYPTVQPEFTWFERHYSPYQSHNHSRPIFGNLSSRGPPALA